MMAYIASLAFVLSGSLPALRRNNGDRTMAISTEDQVAAINNTLVLADEAAVKSNNHRLEAGKMLVALRQQVERQGEKWWKWQEGKFSRSRKDIEKLMRLASAPDPEAAFEEQKARVRDELKRSRERSLLGSNAASDGEHQGVVAQALALVATMTADERHEFMVELKDQYLSANRMEHCDPERAEEKPTVN